MWRKSSKWSFGRLFSFLSLSWHRLVCLLLRRQKKTDRYGPLPKTKEKEARRKGKNHDEKMSQGRRRWLFARSNCFRLSAANRRVISNFLLSSSSFLLTFHSWELERWKELAGIRICISGRVLGFLRWSQMLGNIAVKLQKTWLLTICQESVLLVINLFNQTCEHFQRLVKRNFLMSKRFYLHRSVESSYTV